MASRGNGQWLRVRATDGRPYEIDWRCGAKEVFYLPLDVDRALEALEWWKQFKNTSNEHFLPLIWDKSRYLVLMGGGGSGKSVFAGRKILERCAAEANHRFLVCRKVAKSLRESCFAQLCDQLREHFPRVGAKIRKTELSIRFPNGSEILFAGLDDVEKLKSIHGLTGIWIEEASEISERDFNQLDIRLRGETASYNQIILSFNPISVNHWLKRRFFDLPVENCRTDHSTYRDNRFLDAASRAVLEGYRVHDPYYYAVYCLGQWGVAGESIFDAQAISEHLSRLPPPIAVGRFDYDYDGQWIRAIRWVDDPAGFVKLYEQPVAGRPYVIGGDTAGDGSDRFVATVCENISGRIVAKLRHTFDEDLYARQVYCLGRFYGEALVALEVNHSTYPQRELERLGYRSFYVRERVDTYTGEVMQRFGFRTTAQTRPVILGLLQQMAREHLELFTDADTLEEMLSFVRDEKGRAAAASGAHDDCVMAAAIMFFARSQQRMSVRKAWTREMREDYRDAGSAERRRLRDLWG